MKQYFLAALIALGTSYVYAADEGNQTKQVCVDQMKDGKPVVDAKTNKPKQTCKTIKVHKKHEGTAIPDDKKKK